MSKKINTYRGGVASWECDEVGHMNVMYYVNKFELASNYLNGCFGITRKVMASNQWGTTAVRHEINYRQEVFGNTLLYINSSIVEIGNRSFTAYHEMRDAETNELVSSMRVTSVIFDLETRKALNVPDFARVKMEEML